MPVYNKSGYSHSQNSKRIEGRTSAHIRYSALDKMKILTAVDSLLVEKENLTVAQAAGVVCVDQSMIWRWAKKREEFSSSPRAHPVLQVHPGPSILHDVEEERIRFVEEWHLKDLPVNYITLHRKACSLVPAFGKKSKQAAKMAILLFMARNHLSHCMATHKVQHYPSEVEHEALDFLDVIRPIMSDPTKNLDYVMNMDQTPIFHAMDFKSTIDMVGACTVNLHTTASDSKRVIVAITITASGRHVKSMVVFKGK